VLFRIRGVPIYAYPAMMYLGLVCGVTTGHVVARADGLDADRLTLATVLLVIPALVGSRILFLAVHWRRVRNPAQLLSPRQGGAALYGGLLLALLLSVPVLRALSVPAGAFWDLATITILIGMTFTKVGCFLNGCCAGRASDGPFAILAPDDRGVVRRRIPSQLLESLLAASLLAALGWYWASRPFDGAIFCLGLAGYGLGRFALESTRDAIDRIGPVNVHQVISATLVALSLTYLFGH
jgi:phosphatidylglycerol:prolipoprotein diacylglycerol transferase